MIFFSDGLVIFFSDGLVIFFSDGLVIFDECTLLSVSDDSASSLAMAERESPNSGLVLMVTT